MVRGSNVRMIALASTIALALTLPLAAAIAGPSGPDHPVPADAPSSSLKSGSTERQDGNGPRTAPGAPAQNTPQSGSKGDHSADHAAGQGDGREGDQGGRSGQGGDHGGARGASSGSLLADLGLEGVTGLGRTARCGPEVSSPGGVEAQTCVLTEEGRTRARTYYRNASGDPLSAVVTLMRPDGRTVQAHCEVSAGDEPGTCETPAGRTVRGSAPYTAVAEVADARGERLLLRSGSNSTGPEGRSDR